jgi:hypothetical protein
MLAVHMSTSSPAASAAPQRRNRDQKLQQPEAISMPGTSDGGTARTRTTKEQLLPLADKNHVALAHPCRSFSFPHRPA